MKKLLIIAAALCLAGSPAAAQDWKEALKKAATTALDKATDGKLTEMALVGTWNYTAPGVKFESGDALSDVGAAALSGSVTKQLEKAYRLAGIQPGAGTFTFDKENAFSATMGGHTLSGTYEYDASAHEVKLHFAKGKLNLGSISGHAYISGERLQLVFPITKLVDMVTALGSKISSLNTVTKLLQKYENVYLGFEFDRAAAE